MQSFVSTKVLESQLIVQRTRQAAATHLQPPPYMIREERSMSPISSQVSTYMGNQIIICIVTCHDNVVWCLNSLFVWCCQIAWCKLNDSSSPCVLDF